MQVVFHHARREEAEHVLANVENLLGDDTVAVEDVAVVANADGVRTLTARSEHAIRVRTLREDDGVRFAACRNSLRSRDIEASALADGVETVPAGVGELARLQDDGYGYVKD
ncbi:DsrE family protein [Halobacterium litoreum]|uniref:DsrE family protein n=1 Tax=Halobacterium litoreum TaxID=2039234 RepID=A0ABD5NH10_9EURY|nr:DsrE family protein [Halobacterium litoreum]UHH12541.1 DsrE family protein [Halobacterium litoreum]